MTAGRWTLLGGVAVGVAAAVAWALGWPGLGHRPEPVAGSVAGTRIESAPLCPWRHPAEDLAEFFPGADVSHPELLILSALRPELARRLGHTPSAEDNALHVQRIHAAGRPVGLVAVRRVKGESGAVELVLALETNGVVRGLRYQRMREPEATAAFLGSAAWRTAFAGKGVHDALRPGADLPEPPAPARVSALAVADGVRELLVLLDAASLPGAVRRPLPAPVAPHPHP